MESVHAFPIAVILVAMTVAAVTDLWSFRLYNALTIPCFLLGVLYHNLNDGTVGLAGSVLGALVGTVTLIPVYARGGMGAGDLKLIAGIGAWLGAWHVLHVLIVAGLATGVYAAGIVVWNRLSRTENRTKERRSEGDCLAGDRTKSPTDITVVVRLADARRLAVPFGAMLALGVVGTLVWIGN